MKSMTPTEQWCYISLNTVLNKTGAGGRLDKLLSEEEAKFDRQFKAKFGSLNTTSLPKGQNSFVPSISQL